MAVDFKDSTVNVKNSVWDLNTYRVTATIEGKPFVNKIKETQHTGFLDMTIDDVKDKNEPDCWGYVDYYKR